MSLTLTVVAPSCAKGHYAMAQQELSQAIQDLGLTVDSVFVPWSKSRNAKQPTKDRYAVVGRDTRVTHPEDRSLNWQVTLKQDGRKVITTDYSAGIAHCPSYQAHKPGTCRWTNDAVADLITETETGKTARKHGLTGAPILPSSADVVYSLVSDASVLDNSGFDQWCGDYGYDPDSRKAETIYRACLDIALALRAAIGDSGLTRLRDAAQDY
jgi:hypothetical protein